MYIFLLVVFDMAIYYMFTYVHRLLCPKVDGGNEINTISRPKVID